MRLSSAIAPFVCGIVCAMWASIGMAQTVVQTTEGPVRGTDLGDNTVAYRALPFAAPPIGQYRFAPPQPPKSHTEIYEANTTAPACPQPDNGWNHDLAQSASEDCLYLELRGPKPDGKKRPIMVFIHGGANTAGGGAGTIMSDIGAHGDVVIVSLQYRLGALGFLSHPALSREQNGASGNYALMDIVAALKWIKSNAAAFGGDPENITVFGHSAGAQDTGLLLSITGAEDLFNKLILQSGNPQFGYAARSLRENEAIGEQLAANFTTAPADSDQALSDLRAVDFHSLVSKSTSLKPPINDAGFIWDQVTVDGHILKAAPNQIMKANRYKGLKIIIGVSSTELDLYGGDASFDATRAQHGLKASGYEALPSYMGSPAQALANDLMFRCPAVNLAETLSKQGAEVYLYQLQADRNGKVHHGSEWPYVFDAAPQDGPYWPDLNERWRALAKTGTPNISDKFAWPKYGITKAYLAFGPDRTQKKYGLRHQICRHLKP